MIDLSSIVIYGVPVIAIAYAIIGIIEYLWKDIPEKTERIIQGAAAIGGYLLSTNLPQVESWWPGAGGTIPQALFAIVLFAFVLGVLPDGVLKVTKATVKALKKDS